MKKTMTIKAEKTISPLPEVIGIGEIYQYASKMMPAEEIDHHGNGVGLDDLYLKKTSVSHAIVARYEHKNQVQTFRANDGSGVWYDIPFAYPLVDD